MNRSSLRRLLAADFEKLLDALTMRQHLSPHESVNSALTRVVDSMGVCPNAVARAVEWLGLNPARSIGRLRRTELMQLARSIHRHWRQRTPRHSTAQTSR